MNGTLNRLEQLEARFERLRLDLQDTQRKLTQALQQIRDGQARYVPTGGGSANAIFWAHAPAAIAAATGSWPTLTPSTFTSDIYADQAGTLTLVASSQTVRWFYKDSAAIGSLIPVEPTDNGTAWDAIGNSCTAV
jgi:hypothetical protein